MLEWINGRILGVAVPIFLIGVGIFFGFYLGWFYLLHPKKTLKAAMKQGRRSAFSSLCLALAGTLGVGNIVGVASAIAIGGYGAIFWMWISAFFAMILKYAETVLAMRHRRYRDNAPKGSAMYYIEDCFNGRRGTWIGKVLALVFALLLILNAFSMGSAIQTEAASSALSGAFGIPTAYASVIIGILTLIIMCLGKKGIMSFTEKLVPIMTVLFAVMSVSVLILRANKLPEAFSLIFKDAFTWDAATCGILGFLTSRALRFGTMRGLISNEAGCGTSPTAHSESNGVSPSAQGVWGIFEVFIDTIVLCTATALVIIVSDVSLDESAISQITSNAYAAVLGELSRYVMSVLVAFFGFATVICWSHYGMEGGKYFSERPAAGYIFTAAYIFSVIAGGILSPEILWQIADLSIGGMTVINISVLFLCRKEIKEESRKFSE